MGWSQGCLISTIRIPIVVRLHLYIEAGPCLATQYIIIFSLTMLTSIFDNLFLEPIMFTLWCKLTLLMMGLEYSGSNWSHYNDVIMVAIASQITSLAIVFSPVYLNTDQRKNQSSTALAFVWGSHRRPVNSPHKWPVKRKMFPFDNVIVSTVVLDALTHCVTKPSAAMALNMWDKPSPCCTSWRISATYAT